MTRPLRSALSDPALGPASSRPERLEDELADVARGDERAFERVYERVAGPVYGIVRRVLRDRAQSEDVAHEVLLYVWREASRFDESKGSAMAWIMTIAHRRAVDRVRSEQSWTERQRQAVARDVQTAFDSVVETVETAETAEGRLERAAAREALAALTETQRSSVLLAYFGGLTYGEVADRLGVPLGTVKTRIRDGLIRMRGHLHAEGLQR